MVDLLAREESPETTKKPLETCMAADTGAKNVLFRLLAVQSRQQTPARTGRAPAGRAAQWAAVSQKKRHAHRATNRVDKRLWLTDANYIDATHHAARSGQARAP